jgi:alkylation response protein AidB-like acyl-CoA dehydrogenase
VQFSLSDEQHLLSDSIGKFVSDHSTVERHRQLRSTEAGFDPACWQQFAELGWLCVPFTEDQGGLGGSAADLMVVCEALGRGVVREPYLHTAVICGSLLRFGADQDQQERYLPGLIAGEQQWAFAFAEASGGYSLAARETVAREQGDGWRLAGRKIAVLNGHCADKYIVSACDDAGDTGLFLVDATQSGLRREPFAALDGSRGAVLELDGVEVAADAVLAAPGGAGSLIEAAVDRAIIAMAAESLGAMQCLLDATVEYTKTREQFGQAIGKFQALQHRMADMYMKIEELRSLLFNAVIRMDEDSEESPAACAALKVKMAEAGRFVSQQAVQLHGGIGMTDELIVGHHYKRLLLLSKLFGDEDFYLERYRQLRAA